MAGQIQRFLNAGIEPSEVSPEFMRRIRLITIMSVAFSLVGIPFFFQYLSMGVPIIAAGVVVSILIGVLNLWLLRRFRRPELCGHIGTLIVYFMLVLSNCVSGGFYDPNFAWLYVIPVVAGFVVNIRAVFIYFGLVIVTTLAFFTLPYLGIRVPDLIPGEHHALQSLFNRLAALVAITFLVVGFLVERLRAEMKIQHTREDAEKASQAKSEFLANMSHEIRTPLNAILGMGELLSASQLKPEEQRYLSIMRNAGDNLLELVNDILDIARFESGKLQLESIVFEPETILRNTADMLALGAREKNLEFALTMDPRIPKRLLGDPTRLRQILINLLGNAVKFTEQGEIELKAELYTGEDGEQNSDRTDGEVVRLQFLVRDTGIGIPIEKWEQVFDAFTQADESTTRRFGGSGLGLAIVSRLVELMSGRIRVMSIPDEGSTFHVTLPFQVVAPEDGANTEPTQEDVGDMRVLLLDEDYGSRVLISEYLRNTNITLTAADGPEKFLDDAESREAYHVVLLEYRMAARDGFDLLRRLRWLPALQGADFMLIGSEDPAAGIRELGIRRYLVKPVGKKELLHALTESHGRSAVPSDSLRILLAEDNEDNRLLIQAFLKNTPHEVEYVGDGAQAVERYRASEYDLILMDIQMPVLDGLAATRKIRGLEKENGERRVPILALTAHALREEVEKSLNAGCDAHISKPIKRTELLRIIAHHGRRPALS